MTTKKVLQNRWLVEPGKSIIQRIYGWKLYNPGHGHTAEEVFATLSGLPFREEVPNGRDFRGTGLAADGLNLRNTDFSHAPSYTFYSCDLSGSKFDQSTNENANVRGTFDYCSFVRARLKGCNFNDSAMRNCDFTGARLRDCSFKNCDLTGSIFRGADCEGLGLNGACIIGCDFRGANLEEASFGDLQLDKSTDFRGASLVNSYNQDVYDIHGTLQSKGTDWRLGTYDETTKFGNDKEKLEMVIIQGVKDYLKECIAEENNPIYRRFQELMANVTRGEPGWREKVQSQLTPEECQHWERTVEQAYKSM